MNLDCSAVTTQNSATCVCFLIVYDDSLVFVTLTATFLSIIFDIECEISRLAVSVIFSNVSQSLLCSILKEDQRTQWSLFLIGGIVKASSMRTTWDLTLTSLAVLLTCIVKWGKWMKPCVVWMITLLFFMKSKPMIGPVTFFITTNCSTEVYSPLTKLIVVVASGFSNWPYATWIWKVGGLSIPKILAGICCLILSNWLWRSH